MSLKKNQSPDRGMPAFVILGMALLTAGCSIAPQQGNFSCPYEEGVPCLTISGADDKPQQSNESDEKPQSFETTLFQKSSYPKFTYRAREASKRIWFAPFEDADGNWHESYFVYVVSSKPHWVVGK